MGKEPLWQNLFFTWLYTLLFPRVPSLNKKIWVDERCDACQLCEKICPAQNIRLAAGKPVWLHHCHQCLACLQWCPQVHSIWRENSEIRPVSSARNPK